MKIKTPLMIIEFEILFIIIFFIFLFSNKVKKLLFSFYICYLFIIFHELAHLFIATIFGKNIKKFKFSLSGVNISFEKNILLSKYKEIFIYLAGPISNLIIALLFRYNNMIFNLNIALFFVNLFPIYPLDGYNILFNLLRKTKYEKIKIDILNILTIINFFIIGVLSTVQLVIYRNISFCIFFSYVLLIYQKNKKYIKMYQILAEKTY